jgi:hypothetical protein
MKQSLMVVLVAGIALAVAPFAGAGDRTDDELGIAVSPQKLLLGTVQSGSVLVHTDIPFSAVAVATLKLNGLPAVGAYADALGQVVAVFNEASVKAIVVPPSALMTLTGQYAGGGEFSGSDTVAVEVYRGR